MSHIAILHPQCVRLGGAIQMALQTAQALQKQWHTVTLYTFEKNDTCFSDLQKGLDIRVWTKGKNIWFFPLRKLMVIATLAWELRHVDIIIANNPPMQIVAAITKLFVPRIATLWWHHHIPWYFIEWSKKVTSPLFWKGLFEKIFVVPYIDQMIATSHFIAEKVQNYCGRESKVIHPIIEMREYKTSNTVNSDVITLTTHGRLEAGKGLDMVTRVYERLQKDEIIHNTVNLIVFWTGTLESELRKKGIDIRPFDRETTFSELLSGKYGHVLGVYCSQIDGFGMAPLESQIAGISTVILDSAGARETIVTNLSDEPVGYLVESEEDLFRIISHYVQEKTFPKSVSNVNFSHHRDYFTTERLSSDLLSIINKTEV